MLSSQKFRRDPLGLALNRKAQLEAPGAAEGKTMAAGDGWRVVDIVCTSGPRDRAFEEQHTWASISLVRSGTFVYRSHHGRSLMAPGAMLLGSPGNAFECSHQHGEGDRCLSFQYDPGLFARLAHDAGASHLAFAGGCLPPLRALAPLTARAATAMERQDSFEEISLELASAVIQTVGDARRNATVAARDPAPIAPVLRQLESRAVEPLTLGEMARIAGLSRYHFLRTFKAVTGITPHQWLLRARLRDAARRLATSRDPVTEIALDVGFEDLSNFIRSFRSEFGVSPSRYRATA
ncbi:MAG TPA: AraC family transcriptional regulator [Candidatus Binataceae bacterium]|nr:AraC family transcriptional regulator [Candidatus Binataceae bacterium]